MGPLSRLVSRPPFELSLSKGVLPLIETAFDPNGAILLTQTFNRILFYDRNGQYFEALKAKNGDRSGNNHVYRSLSHIVHKTCQRCDSTQHVSHKKNICIFRPVDPGSSVGTS